MDFVDYDSIKFKFLSFDELVINLDRLSRFKLPDFSYGRVFSYIVLKYLIYPKYSKKELESLNPKYISLLVEKIWNESVKNCCDNFEENNCAYFILKFIINKSFKNLEDKTKLLMDAKLNIAPILKRIDFDRASINLKFLIKANEQIKNKKDFSYIKLIELREKYSLKFPVEKLLIVEGITEEILLPVFADKLKLNFDKKGIYVYGAGGKSKSPNLYFLLKNKLKIPIFLLFDSDAAEISNSLEKNLSKRDKILLIKNGEFEDILSLNLIKRALNKEYLPVTPIIKNELNTKNKMCINIENFYKTRHLGEFKKSKLSKIIAANVKYNTDITCEIKNIIFNLI